MLDADKDGSIMDDLINLDGKFLLGHTGTAQPPAWAARRQVPASHKSLQRLP
jgi:hypothetical protein